MRNLKLKNLLAMCLFLLVEFSYSQEIESIIRYDLKTTTSYSIDECSYQSVEELNPIYWIDKQNEFVKTRVTEIHYDDFTATTEIIYVDSENYFPSWIKKKPYKLIIDMDKSTAYDISGNVISSIPRSPLSIDIQLNLGDTYLQQYFVKPTFSEEWVEQLIKLGFVKIKLSENIYKLISEDLVFIINDQDYTVTSLEYENGELVNQNVIKKSTLPLVNGEANNNINTTNNSQQIAWNGEANDNTNNTNNNTGGQIALSGITNQDDSDSGKGTEIICVLDDVTNTVIDTLDDGIKFTKVLSKSYSNYEFIFYNRTKSRSREENPPKEVFITPNPASELVTISQEIDQPTQLRIVNVQGKTIYTNDNFKGEDQINISSFIPGIYFVQLSNKNEIITDKLIIK